MAQPKIILHWLNLSRSNRILWLLELLKVDYELKIYKRTPKFRAPAELKKIHPLGKSPVIEVVQPNGDNIIVSETGSIIEYLLEHFDKSKKLAPTTEEGKRLVSYYLHFTEGTLQPVMTGSFVNLMAKNQAPFGAKTLVGFITNQINTNYFGSEALLNLQYLEDIAKKNNGGYFVDNKLTGADVVLSFPLTEMLFEGDPTRVQELLKGDPNKLYPYLSKWSKLVSNDPDHLKVEEIVKSKL